MRSLVLVILLILTLAAQRTKANCRSGHACPETAFRDKATVPTSTVYNFTVAQDTPKATIQAFKQYQYLRTALEKYQAICRNGGWETIPWEKNIALDYGCTASEIEAVRKRLHVEGYLSADSHSPVFDQELLSALHLYQYRHNQQSDSIISGKVIGSMNIPVEDRIRTIEVNLERCRLIQSQQDEGSYIAVNIPAFKLYFVKQGKLFLVSKVVVGKEATKTVVFNSTMDQIIFCPYWNIPSGIARKEIIPLIKKNPKILSQRRMEWYNGRLRQKPGPSNALGLVKFVFPNSHNIYLHDTPQKAYFKEEKRAFSHGCIRVEKASELAAAIMQDDYGWTAEETTEAMTAGKQKACNLKTRIPVYIVYFTAWADDKGNVAFYPDIYGHDARSQAARR